MPVWCFLCGLQFLNTHIHRTQNKYLNNLFVHCWSKAIFLSSMRQLNSIFNGNRYLFIHERPTYLNILISVNRTHHAFKTKMKVAIQKKVELVQRKQLSSDTLLSVLNKELPECKVLSNTSFLKLISSLFRLELSYVGKSQSVDQIVTFF